MSCWKSQSFETQVRILDDQVKERVQEGRVESAVEIFPAWGCPTTSAGPCKFLFELQVRILYRLEWQDGDRKIVGKGNSKKEEKTTNSF